MKKSFLVLMTLFLLGSANSMVYGFIRPIVLQHVLQLKPLYPGIDPTSLTNSLPCDIEAYQTESGVEIIVNDVALVGSYHVYVFDHHHGEIVYSNSFFWQDGSTSFISTSTWPEDTYTLYIAIPGGWLEGEFEIEDFFLP